MPLNPQLDTLSDYPFEALRTLLNPVTPVVNDPPILMSVGEPQHQPPALLTETLMAHAQEWNKYPSMAGTPELRQAIADWLTRRYRLPAGAVDAERNVLTLAGTKEGLYLFSSLVVPRLKAGQRPVVLVPNPYYLVYNGAATMAGADAVFLDATRENAFMPDLAAIPRETLERTALFYLCSPANPQGAIASLDYLKQAIRLAREYDFVLAVDECYAEIYDQLPPPGALEACAALGSGFDQCCGVSFVVEAVERGRAALRLCRRRPEADRALLAFARAMAAVRCHCRSRRRRPRYGATRRMSRQTARCYRRKFDIAAGALEGRFGFYRPDGGFFLWLDVGDGEAATVRLWRDAAIRVLPGGYTARAADGRENPGSRYIRLAIVHDDATLDTAFSRIRRVL